MTQEVFIAKVCEVLMANNSQITQDTELARVAGWDSMGKLVFLTFLDEEFSVRPPLGALDACKTMNDLAALVKDKLED